MTMQDAANLVSVTRAEKDILNDPSLNWMGKAKALTVVEQAAAAQPEKQPWLTMGDITRGAVGAGLGYGVGTIMGKLFGVAPETLSTFKNMGMGLGTLLNTGIIGMNKNSADRTEEERRHAFRYGFVKAALDLGLIKTALTTTLPITPDLLTSPVNLVSNVGTSLAGGAGTLAGTVTGGDPADVDIELLHLQQRQLMNRAHQIVQGRRARKLKQVLDKRNQVVR